MVWSSNWLVFASIAFSNVFVCLIIIRVSRLYPFCFIALLSFPTFISQECCLLCLNEGNGSGCGFSKKVKSFRAVVGCPSGRRFRMTDLQNQARGSVTEPFFFFYFWLEKYKGKAVMWGRMRIPISASGRKFKDPGLCAIWKTSETLM